MSKPLVAHFHSQARACERLGSPFTAAVLELLAEQLDAGHPALAPVAEWPGDPSAGALGLRVTGVLHRLVLEGFDPALTALYAEPDPQRVPVHATAILAALERHPMLLAEYLDRPPQTNEVARSAMLLGGFLTLAARTGLPLALYELGASAGLNLLWDRYRYDFGTWHWGEHHPGPLLETDWSGPPPPLVPVRVVDRRGCDRRPIDLRDPAERQRLRSYVWADQHRRLRRLDAAMALGQELRVEADDAATWLAERVTAPQAGCVRVVYHSIVWQYLPHEIHRTIAETLATVGRRATADAPLAWLRFEPGGDGPALTLTQWPDGETAELASGDYHGRWMRWYGRSP